MVQSSKILRQGINALPALDIDAELLPAPLFGKHPRTNAERWIVSNVLEMSACQHGPPMSLFVLRESDNRTAYRRAAGFHHKKIVSAMSQQTSEATTSGTICPNS